MGVTIAYRGRIVYSTRFEDFEDRLVAFAPIHCVKVAAV